MNRLNFAILTTAIFFTANVIKFGLSITLSAPILTVIVLTGLTVYALDDLQYEVA